MALVSLVNLLGQSDASDVLKGLSGLRQSCCCSFNGVNGFRIPNERTSSPCGVENFVISSPQCLELFRIWAAVDPLVASGFIQLGLFTSSVPGMRFCHTTEIEENTAKAKAAFYAKRAELLSCLVECFALVLEHTSLDSLYPSTTQSRKNLGHRLLSTCLRSLYRILQLIDKTRSTQTAIAQLLAALQTVSIPLTSQFLNEFNFTLPSVHRLFDSVAFSSQTVERSIRNGNDLISLGVLGNSVSIAQERQRQCRRHALRWFRLLLATKNDSITLKVLEIRNLASRVTRSLYMDSVEDCLEVLQCLDTCFISNSWLSKSSKRRLCRPALFSDFARILAVYATIIEGSKNPDTKLSSTSELSHISTPEYKVVTIIEKAFTAVVGKNGLLTPQQLDFRDTLCEICSHLSLLPLHSYQRIIITILSAHPGAMPLFMTTLQASAGFDPQPRLTALWIKNVAFTLKLIDLAEKTSSSDSWKNEESISMESKGSEKLSQEQALEDHVVACCRGTVEPSTESHTSIEYWEERFDHLKHEGKTQKYFLALVLAGYSKLISRPVLTSAVLNDSKEIVYAGLLLTSKVCSCLRSLQNSITKSDQASITKNLLETVRIEVFNRLPEISTMIQALQHFGNADAFRQRSQQNKSSPEIRRVPFDIKQPSSGDKTVLLKTASKFEIGSDDDDDVDIAIGNIDTCIGEDEGNGRKRVKDLEENNTTGNLSNDSMRLTMTESDAEATLSRLVNNSKNGTIIAHQVLPLKDVEYDLRTLLGEIKANSENGELFLDLEFLFSQWCSTIVSMFEATPMLSQFTKFDWTKLLAYSWPLQLMPDHHCSIIKRTITIIKTLDAVWMLDCCPTDAECETDENEAKSKKQLSQRRRSLGGERIQFHMKMARSYLSWLECVFDLWGDFLSEKQYTHLNHQELTTSKTFCEVTIHRFFERTSFFYSQSLDESFIWMNYLKTSSVDFIRFFFAVLRNVTNFLIPFTEAASRLISSTRCTNKSALDDHGTNHFEILLSPSLPVSIFVIAMLYHWQAKIPTGLARRHLYLNFPRLSCWQTPNSSTDRESQVTKISTGAEICAFMSEILQRICAYRGSEATSTIKLICSNSKWKNILIDTKKVNEEDKTVSRAIKKAKTKIKHLHYELKNLIIPSETFTRDIDIEDSHQTKNEKSQRKRKCADIDTPSKRNKTGEDEVSHRDMITDDPFMDCDDNGLVSSAPYESLTEKIISLLRLSEWSHKETNFNDPWNELINRLINLESEKILQIICNTRIGKELLQLLRLAYKYEDKFSLPDKMIFIKTVSVLIDFTNQIAIGSFNSTVDKAISIDCLASLWILIIWIRDKNFKWFHKNKIRACQTKKSWSRKKTSNEISSAELGDLLFNCQFIKSQFQHHFLSSSIQKDLPTASQTSIVHLLAYLHQFRLNQNTKFTSQSSNITAPDIEGIETEILPCEWIENLLQRYSGSLSDFDRYCRILLLNPSKLKNLRTNEWTNNLYDFREVYCEFGLLSSSLDSSSVLLSPSLSSIDFPKLQLDWGQSIDWLLLNPQRRAMTTKFFPIHRQFAPSDTFDDFTNLVDEYSSLLPSHIGGAELVNVPGMKPGVGIEKPLASLLIYDPAMLIPYLAGRMRVAWIIVEEQRQHFKRLPGGPIRNLLEFPSRNISRKKNETVDHEESTKDERENGKRDVLTQEEQAHAEILKNWCSGLDVEGVWLRRVATGGALEMLILGSTSIDNVIRCAAIEGLGLYRSLLITAESDARSRAERYNKIRLHKKALRNLKERGTKARLEEGLDIRKPSEDEIKEEMNSLSSLFPLTVRHPFKELREVLTLLQLLKTSIEIVEEKSDIENNDNNVFGSSLAKTTSLPIMLAAFAITCLPILLDASHPLYLHINRFLTSRPFVANPDVPLFMKFFWSDRPETLKLERSFVAEMLHLATRSGGNTTASNTWKLISRRLVLPLLLDEAHRISITGETDPYNFWSSTVSCLLQLTRGQQCDPYNSISVYLINQYALLDWVEVELKSLHSVMSSFENGYYQNLSLLDTLSIQARRLESLALLLCQLLSSLQLVESFDGNLTRDENQQEVSQNEHNQNGDVTEVPKDESVGVYCLLKEYNFRHRSKILSLMRSSLVVLHRFQGNYDDLFMASKVNHESTMVLLAYWKLRIKTVERLLQIELGCLHSDPLK